MAERKKIALRWMQELCGMMRSSEQRQATPDSASNLCPQVERCMIENRDNRPFTVTSAIFLVVLSLVSIMTLRVNDGRIVYTLDDPYIHMAIANNLVTHGVFGVTRDAFSSSTSSPLWTLLLAAVYRLLGTNDWVPGVLAAIFALGALYATNVLARALDVGMYGRFFTLLCVVFFTPLVAVVSTGMEHAMHVFFVIALFAATVSFVRNPGRISLGLLCLCSFMATGTRYESMFLLMPLALVLAFLKQWRAGLLMVAAGALPIIAYGVFSYANGSYFLPNSLMLKGNFPQADGIKSIAMALGGRSLVVLYDTPHLLAVAVLLSLGATNPHRPQLLRFLALSLVCSVLIHLQFASVGWFYRYEAYLVAVSIAIIPALYLPGFRLPESLSLTSHRPLSVFAFIACVGLLLGPLAFRGAESLLLVTRASNHIYGQQIQMANFLRQEYSAGVRVALNDLGAVSYYADASILDLWGLGTIEVTRAKRRREYDSRMIERLLTDRQVDVVMVYSDWFRGENALPKDLIPVADWTTTRNYYGRTVTFFTLSEDQARELTNRLERYESNLPPSIEVQYKLTEQSTAADGLSPAAES